jgi:hypothetical protein
VVLIEAACKTRLELDGGLADTKNLGSSSTTNGANEVDTRARSALVKLRAKGKFAITLGTKVVTSMIAGASENTVTIHWNNRSSRIDVVGQCAGGIGALELINRLTR